MKGETAIALLGLATVGVVGATLILRARAGPVPPPPPPTQYNVTVQVWDASTLTPLENAAVTVFQDSTAIVAGRTDAEGNVIFALRAGSYTAEAGMIGYTSATKPFAVVNQDIAFSVQLTPTGPPPPPPPSTGDILATVLDASTGQVILNASVAADGYTGVYSNGVYAIEAIPPGTYAVGAVATGYQTAETIVAVEAGLISRVTLRLQPTAPPPPPPTYPIVISSPSVSDIGGNPPPITPGETILLSATFTNISATTQTVVAVVQVLAPDQTPLPPIFTRFTLAPGQQMTPIWGTLIPTNAMLGTWTAELVAFSDLPAQGGYQISEQVVVSFQVA